MFALVDTSALLSREVLCSSSPQVWLRASQSLTRDLQHVFCSPPALGTHQSHRASSLCGLANIWRASCLIVVVALILLVWLILSSQGSTYRQWPVGLVRPQRVFKHIESTWVRVALTLSPCFFQFFGHGLPSHPQVSAWVSPSGGSLIYLPLASLSPHHPNFHLCGYFIMINYLYTSTQTVNTV